MLARLGMSEASGSLYLKVMNCNFAHDRRHLFINTWYYRHFGSLQALGIQL